MTDLTEKWKKGKLPEGEYYCKTGNGVETLRTWRSIGGYLSFENRRNEVFIGSMDDCEVLAEVPSYKEWQELKEFADYSIHNRDELTRQINFWIQENAKLKKQVNHLSKTQAKQFRDNQKLQVTAEHAKDVVNIDTARQIKQLKELLKDCYSANQAFIKTFEWLETIITPIQRNICLKTAEGIKKLQSEIDEVLK